MREDAKRSFKSYIIQVSQVTRWWFGPRWKQQRLETVRVQICLVGMEYKKAKVLSLTNLKKGDVMFLLPIRAKLPEKMVYTFLG